MHLFTNYIQPLTFWLYAHPHWALFITFLISFGESLAIIGSIIPGSVTMTAIGILAGSGVMRIDLTFLAATLGAIAGDSGSYALGYTFSDRLVNIWPFKKYPKWLIYGQDYFSRHGATSVLIGRFVGPMRSIIPVIAGMMHMKHWHFLIANGISAVAWAILYVTPGVLIGAASSELSTESATRLFVLILIFLIVVWLLSLSIKWLVVHTNHYLRSNLHNAWTWLKNRPRLMYLTKLLAPHNEINHFSTAALTILFILCFIFSLVTITLIVQGSWITTINNPVNLFFQSIRTQPFDAFFVTVILMVGPLPLLTLLLAVSICAIYFRDWQILRFWLTLGLTTGITIFLLTYLVDQPKPIGLLRYHAPPLFPDTSLTYASALFGFLIYYIRTHYNSVIMLITRVLFFILLALAGIALIYLGDNWIVSVIASYFIGLTLFLLHWIFYRRSIRLHQRTQTPILIACFLFISAGCVSYSLHFKQMVHAHGRHLAQYVLTDQVWWNQQQPLLPIYTTNRIGKQKSLLNIQYAGSINKLQQELESAGWKPQPDSFLYLLLVRAGGENSTELPLLAQLYQNKKPNLVMTYNSSDKKIVLIMRLWRSNYHLRHYPQPIWLGSVDRLPPSQVLRLSKKERQLNHQKATLDYFIEALQGFEFKKIRLPPRYLRSLYHPTSSVLLLIKARLESP
jgi:membrane protein DedA with SNARE-associated domain